MDELPREAHGVRPACWRCREGEVGRKREQAPRTPNASRSSVATLLRSGVVSSPMPAKGTSGITLASALLQIQIVGTNTVGLLEAAASSAA